MENNKYKGTERRGRYAICKPLETKEGNIYYKGVLNYFGEVSTIIVFKDDKTGNVKVNVTKWNQN